MKTVSAILALASLPAFPQEDYRVEEGKGAIRRTLHLEREALALEASPDGKRLALGVRGKVLVVEFADGKLVSTLETGRGAIRGLAFSPDGKQLGVAAIGGVSLIDIESGKVLWKAVGHPSSMKGGEGAYGVAFTTDGSELLTVSVDDPNLRCWSAKDGAAGKVVDTKTEPRRIAVSGDLVAISSSSEVQMYGKELVQAWKARVRLAGGLAFAPGGGRLAVGVTGQNAGVESFDSATGKRGGRIDFAGSGALAGVAWTPDGKALVTAAARAGGVKLWTTGKEAEGPTADLDPAFRANEDADRAAVVGLGGKAAAVAGREKQVRIYSLP